MKYFEVCCIFCLMCLFSFTVNAQNPTVSGTVISANDSMPIPGVTVVVKGTTTGTITDLDGNYSIIPSSSDDTLVFSFVGMQTSHVPIKGRSKIDVAMQSGVVDISEVVVTAMGIKREKKALGYATQQVKGDEVSESGEEDISKALMGKAAGISVKQMSGMPGSGSQIRIRGASSINLTNQPLFVVDGMPIDSDQPFAKSAGGTGASSRTLDINPNDIETINILKGPAAAALYGLKASNGVVIITTKSGAGTEKTNVTINSSYTNESISRLPKLQSTYAQGNDGGLDLYSQYSWGPRIDTLKPYHSQPENLQTNNPYNYPINGEPTNTAKVYDNVSPFFQNGQTFKNSVSVTTSGKLGHYAIGFSATNQEGIIPTTSMDKYTAKFNGTVNLTDKLKAGASINYANIDVGKVPDGSNRANPLFSLYFAPRSYDLKGKPYESSENEYIQQHYRTGVDNPYWALEHNKYTEETQRFFGNFNFNYEPFDWLNANYRLGLDNYFINNKDVVSLGSGEGRAYPEITGQPKQPFGGQINNLLHEYTAIYSNLQINVKHKFADMIRMDLILGNEFEDRKSISQTILGTGIQIGGFQNVMGTNEQITSQVNTFQRNIGFFGNMTLDYKSMLFLTLTGRTDIVSNMPEGHRTFFYPSVSLGYVFTEMPYVMENWKFLTYGKVRASVAQVGQAGGIYATKNYYLPASHGTGLSSGVYSFPYNELVAFTSDNTLRSDRLRPQNTQSFELGVDLRFINNRFGIDYTYYYSLAQDQIFNVPIARSTGYANEYRNAGEMESRGHEVMLSLKPIKTNDYGWTVQTNFSTNQNTVKALAEGVERLAVQNQDGASQNFEGVGIFAYEGEPYPIIFGPVYVRDDNDNIVVDSRETIDGSNNPNYGMPLQGAPDIIAKVSPDFNINLINTFNYKSIELKIQFDYQNGGNMFSGMNALLWAYGMDKSTENREEGLTIDGKKGYVDENGELKVVGDNDIRISGDNLDVYYDEVLWNITESAVFETTFLRLREVRLSYDLPKKLFSNMFVSNVSVFALGRNLWLSTDYPNFDPEMSTSSGNGIGGYEYVALPNTKSFGGGVKIGF